MNKFFVLALVALSSSMVLCQDETDSQAIIPGDVEETAYVPDNLSVFKDFCITSRDFVFGDIKRQTNEKASGVFQLLFNSAIDVANEGVAAQRLGVDRIGNQIANPDAEIAGSDGSAAGDAIAAGQRAIQADQIQPKSIFDGIVATLKATGGAVASAAANKFEAMKNKVGVPAVVQAAQNACSIVAKYEKEIHDQFETYRSRVADKDAALGSASLAQVKCTTAGRINTVSGICSLVQATRSPVLKMFNRV